MQEFATFGTGAIFVVYRRLPATTRLVHLLYGKNPEPNATNTWNLFLAVTNIFINTRLKGIFNFLLILNVPLPSSQRVLRADLTTNLMSTFTSFQYMLMLLVPVPCLSSSQGLPRADRRCASYGFQPCHR